MQARNNRLKPQVKVGITTALCLLVIITANVCAYLYTIQLPLGWDDLWRFSSHIEVPWSEVLTGRRPLAFITLKALISISGGVHPPLIHALNLGIHGLNSCLVFAFFMLLKLPHRRWQATAGALLFCLYPLSAEAVAWAPSLNHLLTTALVLGTVILLLLSLTANRGKYWLCTGSILCALLAPFGNESGVIIPLLLFMLLWVKGFSLREKGTWFTLTPYIVCAFLGIIGYRLMVPNDIRLTNWQFTLTEPEKYTGLLQGLAYPLAPIAARIYRLGIQVSPSLYCVIICLLALGSVLWYLKRRDLIKYALLAFGWFIFASAPAVVMMPTIYVLRGPRLFYLASIGAALLWSLPLSAFPNQTRKTIASGAIPALAICLSIPYLHMAHSLHWQVKQTVDTLLHFFAAKRAPALVVNLPGYFQYHQSVHLLDEYEGRMLYRFRPDHPLDLNELFRLNGLTETQVQSVLVPGAVNQQHSMYELGYMSPVMSLKAIATELRSGTQIYSVRIKQQVSLVEPGFLEEQHAQKSDTFLARYEDIIALLDMQVEQMPDEWRLDLRWQCWRTPEKDMMVLLHIYDSSDNMVSLQDAYPLMGLSRPMDWQPGDIWHDIRYVTIPDNLPSGTYTVTTGLYYLGENARPAGFAQDGSRLHWDEVTVGTFTVP